MAILRGIDYYREDSQDWPKHVGTNINNPLLYFMLYCVLLVSLY